MLGVLVCQGLDAQGEVQRVVLRAFSGQVWVQGLG